MKKTIKLAVVAALALGTTSAFATNGVNLMGIGAKSRAMGGTGVAQFQGAESGFNNPALIANVKGTEVSIAGTYFSPSVSLEQSKSTPLVGAQAGTNDSAAGASMLPAISMASKINDNFAWGLALYGVAGMGVDYLNEKGSTDPENKTFAGGSNDNWLVMRFALPLAYTTNNFSVGFAPIIQYGLLTVPQMGGHDATGAAVGAQSTGGVASDLGLGFEIGAAYTISGLTLGLDYKSAISQQYKNVFNSNIDGSGASATTDVQDKLATPASFGIGASYNMNEHTIAIDYKLIQYGSADGLDDFGWEDQSVYAIGYEYATTGWALRAGYNYGASPINTDVAADGSNQEVVMGSLIQFPGVTESHYSLGGTYEFSEKVSMDLAYVYATGSASADLAFPTTETTTITATNDQSSLTAAVNFNF